MNETKNFIRYYHHLHVDRLSYNIKPNMMCYNVMHCVWVFIYSFFFFRNYLLPPLQHNNISFPPRPYRFTRFRFGNSNQIRGRLTPVSYRGMIYGAKGLSSCLLCMAVVVVRWRGVDRLYGCPISWCAWASRLFFFRRVKDLRPF